MSSPVEVCSIRTSFGRQESRVTLFRPACPLSGKVRSVLQQQRLQHRAVAARFFRTVTAHCKIGPVGESGQEHEEARGLRLFHFSTVSLREAAPRPLIRSMKCLLDQGLRRRKVWKPHVVEISRRMLSLRHAARWAAYGPQAQALTGCSRASQPYYPNSHSNRLLRSALAMHAEHGVELNPVSDFCSNDAFPPRESARTRQLDQSIKDVVRAFSFLFAFLDFPMQPPFSSLPKADVESSGSRVKCVRTCSGSLTAQGRNESRAIDPLRIAFHSSNCVGTLNSGVFTAPYPARTFPCQRFSRVITATAA